MKGKKKKEKDRPWKKEKNRRKARPRGGELRDYFFKGFSINVVGGKKKKAHFKR